MTLKNVQKNQKSQNFLGYNSVYLVFYSEMVTKYKVATFLCKLLIFVLHHQTKH